MMEPKRPRIRAKKSATKKPKVRIVRTEDVDRGYEEPTITKNTPELFHVEHHESWLRIEWPTGTSCIRFDSCNVSGEITLDTDMARAVAEWILTATGLEIAKEW